jgi:hypothetical protein
MKTAMFKRRFLLSSFCLFFLLTCKLILQHPVTLCRMRALLI